MYPRDNFRTLFLTGLFVLDPLDLDLVADELIDISYDGRTLDVH